MNLGLPHCSPLISPHISRPLKGEGSDFPSAAHFCFLLGGSFLQEVGQQLLRPCLVPPTTLEAKGKGLRGQAGAPAARHWPSVPSSREVVTDGQCGPVRKAPWLLGREAAIGSFSPHYYSFLSLCVYILLRFNVGYIVLASGVQHNDLICVYIVK